MSSFAAWFLALRPKTLPASLAPVLLGSALAFADGYFHLAAFLLALVCALSLQLAVNFANDLFDAEKGVDTQQRLGPLRGLQLGWMQPEDLKKGLVLVLAIALVSGLMLAALVSWWLLVFGLASLLAALAYSGGPYPLASHALGEVLVLVFFGWLAVMGSYFIHTLQLNWTVFGYATLIGLLSASIMLVNNLRDRYTDARAGKKTLVVYLGGRASRSLYRGILFAAPLMHWMLNPYLNNLTWLPLVFVLPFIAILWRWIGHLDGQSLNRMLAFTSLLLLVYSLSHSFVLILL